MRVLKAGLVSVVAALAMAVPASAAHYTVALPVDPSVTPAGYRINGLQATRVADRTATVRAERRRGPLRSRTFVVPGLRRWEISYLRAGKELVRATVDGRTGRIAGKVWTGPYIEWPVARGTKSAFRDRLDVALIALAVLFLIPFLDFRRPRRLLHLDMLAFASFVPPLILFNTGHLYLSVPLQYVPLLYLLARLLWVGLRGFGDQGGALAGWVSRRVLLAGIALLAVGRIAFNLEWGPVGDVGYAGVFGADSLQHGWNLYTVNPGHLDTYGPLNYLLYLPFEVFFPLGPGWQAGSLSAAHAAAIFFDFAVVGAIAALCARVRLGSMTALAIVYAWLACPLTLLPLVLSANDAIVPMFVLLALLAPASPVGRGVMLGLGGAAKFAPLALVPLLGPGRSWSLRALVLTVAAATAATMVAFLPYIHQSGFQTVWDSTLGFQLSRSSPFTLWGLHPSLDWLHYVAKALALTIVVATFCFPRERSTLRLAAASAAIILALQMAGNYWAFTYVSWFAAPALFALVGGTAPRSAAARAHVERERAPVAVAAST